MKSRLFSAFTVLLVLVLTMMLTACFPPPRHRGPAPRPVRHKAPPPPRYYRSEIVNVDTMLALMDTKNMVASLDLSATLVHVPPRRYFISPLLPALRLYASPPPPRHYRPAPRERYYRHVPPPPPRRYTAPPPRRYTPPPPPRRPASPRHKMHSPPPPHHRGT